MSALAGPTIEHGELLSQHLEGALGVGLAHHGHLAEATTLFATDEGGRTAVGDRPYY